MPYVEINNLGKVYGSGSIKCQALKNVNLSVKEGEFVCIMGASGSGKTTLLNIISGLDTPSSGSVFVNGVNIFEKNAISLARYRRRDIGIVFQHYNLIHVLTVRENIELQIRLDHKTPIKEEIDLIIKKLGLEGVQHKLPNQLSGGEQQRVAIGRALAAKPMLILADEPTGNLDSKNGENILKLIQSISYENKITIIMITHDSNVAKYADKVYKLKDGEILSN